MDPNDDGFWIICIIWIAIMLACAIGFSGVLNV